MVEEGGLRAKGNRSMSKLWGADEKMDIKSTFGLRELARTERLVGVSKEKST